VPETPVGPAKAEAGAGGRVRSHCRFRKRGTESLSKSVVKKVNVSTTRERDRTRAGGLLDSFRYRHAPGTGPLQPAAASVANAGAVSRRTRVLPAEAAGCSCAACRGLHRGCSAEAKRPWAAGFTAQARPGRLSVLSVFHSKFLWRFCMGAQGA
jgi:hypothetical protein